MSLLIKMVDVWAGTVADQPGGLAGVLNALAEAGADIDCCIARRNPARAGQADLFLSPVKGKKAKTAATSVGLTPAANLATLRVQGADKPGLGRKLTGAIADAKVNLRGVSALVQGKKFVAYFGFDNAEDARKAADAIKAVAGKKKKK